ncbi:hypothetical protein FHR23_001701 [Stakelama sediminis]|uniref:Uncharacterized protein n=1 Tax=Stakelama sediminis TaxID=463200 RepID=A0A840YYM2_9SPHN|nr:hypothetical protein [Stakelama sediminis]
MAILFPSHGSDQTHHGLDFIPIAAALVAIFAARKHRAAGTERSTNGR